MFFLLPGAERNRKKLLTVLAVLSLCVQSCFPLSFVDDAVHAVLGPVMQPITRLPATKLATEKFGGGAVPL